MAEVLRQDLKQQEKQQTDAKAFISIVKKYTDMKELDATILREFIDQSRFPMPTENPGYGKSLSFITLSVHLTFHGLSKKPHFQPKTARNGIAV